MPLYLLDTNILIDLAGEKISRPFFEDNIPKPGFGLSTSILCMAEYMAGANSKEEKFLKNWIKSGEGDVHDGGPKFGRFVRFSFGHDLPSI